MNRSVEVLLPSWKVPGSVYLNKQLNVWKKKSCIDNIALSGKEFIVFGRKKENCDVVLDHSSISRVHAVLFFGELGSIYVMDLGSSHGTFICEKRLVSNEPALLGPEEELRFGQSSRTYKLENKSSRPVVPAFDQTSTGNVAKLSISGNSSNSCGSGEGCTSEVLTGDDAIQHPAGNDSKSKEQEREDRRAQIAAFAAEMSSTVPIFTSSKVISATSAALISHQTAELEAEGAQWEYGDEESDSEEQQEGRSESDENEEEDDLTREVSESVEEVRTGRVQGAAQDAGGDIEQLALSKKIPLSHQVDLAGHTKAVSSLSVEPSGNRIVTASLDYNVKMFDFGGMDRRHLAFRTVEVQDGHPVISVSHSPSGDRFVVCTSSCQPKVYTRDGEDVITFCRGDMYLRDLSNTKGHTMEVSSVQWHPENKNIILTAGMEGALRLWDLTGEALFGNLINKHVLKLRSKTGQSRVGASSCCFTKDGTRVIAGGTDGSIHIWNTHKHYSRPDIVIPTANLHTPESHVIAVRPSPTDRGVFASRGEDGTVRLWDMRVPKAPIKTMSRAHNMYPTANVEFSPDGTLLCCGTSPMNDDDKSMLYFYDISPPSSKTSGSEVSPCLGIGVASGCSAIYVVWQPKTNQIICSTSSGKTRIFFDPRLSVKGAVLTAGRNPKREKDPSDYAAVGEIYTPNALPMYRQENIKDAGRRKAELWKDPIRSKIPEKPGTGVKKTAENTSFFFTKYVMEGKKSVDKDLHKSDPREALLKMEELASKDPIFFGSAYQQTQPKRQLHHETFEEEQDGFKKKQRGGDI